jgi:hypothetical protein
VPAKWTRCSSEDPARRIAIDASQVKRCSFNGSKRLDEAQQRRFRTELDRFVAAARTSIDADS